MAFIIRKRKTVIKLFRRKQVKVPGTPAAFIFEERAVGQIPLRATALPADFTSQSEPLRDYEMQRLEAEVFTPNRALLAEAERQAQESLVDPLRPLRSATEALREAMRRSQDRPVSQAEIDTVVAVLRGVVTTEPRDSVAEARVALERACVFVEAGGYPRRANAPEGHPDVGALWKGINEAHKALRTALQRFDWVSARS
ncbi:hypothetical protein AAFF27_10990 [Xylophilus sp. GW821-FHT01B05]